MTSYVELHAVSNFSFLRGASHPEELVERAHELGYAGLALTDECSLAGVVRAHSAARRRGMPLIVGSELCLDGGPRLLLLATDRDGYGNLSELITRGRRNAGKGRYRLGRKDLEPGMPGCLALLLDADVTDPLDLRWFQTCFADRGWLAVELFRDGRDAARLRRWRTLSARTGLPLVASGDVHMHRRSRRALQDVLTAIRLGQTVEQAGLSLFANGERHLRPLDDLVHLYPPELLAQTGVIASRCRFSLGELRYEYPAELVPRGVSPADYLRSLTETGMARRWPRGVPDKVRGQIAYELRLIAELGYEAYFLTVHDIVRFARSRGILCQGRGSAANSAVCYCLGITEVDPARMEMLFERFISKERNEPPDIDVDFEHQRREEVIQYLYGKYGRDRAALAATVISYRPKSALRDVGKALSLSLEQVDRLAAAHGRWDGRRLDPERLREAGFDPDSPRMQRLRALVEDLLGFPRHLSQHVGGFVIAAGRLSRLVPIENAAMADRTVIQWDKDDLEALGLLKVDCLALGMLSAVRRAFESIAQLRGENLSMASLPVEDPAVYRMIQKADTVGVFQIESRGQMAMLPRLKPANFYDLVIEVAIVRPGPIQGDMVHPFLRRRQGAEPVSYPSEAVRGVLERTLGVPIFQEQVIKLATVAAGFTPGEADRLRRSMAAWRRRGGLEPFERQLLEGMTARGYDQQFARQIYQQILGFGEYGFPESHAASFALLVYVSAWLKYYEPAVFTCALLNSQPMGFYAPAQLIADLRTHGGQVRPVDVQHSQWECTLEPVEGSGQRVQPALRLGLSRIKGLSRQTAERLLDVRRENPFTSLDDLVRRVAPDRRDRNALATADALSSLGGHRHQVLWEISGLQPPLPLLPQIRDLDPSTPLPEPCAGEAVMADYQSLGLSLRVHPLALLRKTLQRLGLQTSRDVVARTHGAWVRTCGLVITRQRPNTATGVTFVTMEDEQGTLNVIVWGSLAEKQRRTLLGARLMGVFGEVQREGEVLHLIARNLEDHTALLGELGHVSRDFH